MDAIVARQHIELAEKAIAYEKLLRVTAVQEDEIAELHRKLARANARKEEIKRSFLEKYGALVAENNELKRKISDASREVAVEEESEKEDADTVDVLSVVAGTEIQVKYKDLLGTARLFTKRGRYGLEIFRTHDKCMVAPMTPRAFEVEAGGEKLKTWKKYLLVWCDGEWVSMKRYLSERNILINARMTR